MKSIIMIILEYLFLPLVLVIQTIRSRRQLSSKFILIFGTLIFFGPLWFIATTGSFYSINNLLYETGITDRLTHVQVSGTSMLPTISEGESVTLHNPNKFNVEVGDIVSFQNEETFSYNYLKRVIAEQTDTVSLINGEILINDQVLDEPYVKDEQSTYGNTFLEPCQKYTVPEDHLLVLGDNRIVSVDSRILGFIHEEDIEGVIKSEQKPLPTDRPLRTRRHSRYSLNTTAFLRQLTERRSRNAHLLEIDEELNQVAVQRSTQIAEGSDETIPPLEDTLEANGYDYILVRDVLTYGFLSEEELVEHISQHPRYRDDFLSERYYKLGVGTAMAQDGDCRYPVINVILSWPAEPRYSENVRELWQTEVQILEETVNSLQSLESNPQINPQKRDKLVSQFTEELADANRILSRMEQEQWLSDEENSLVQEYPTVRNANISDLQEFVRDNNLSRYEFSILTKQNYPRTPSNQFNEKSNQASNYFDTGDYRKQHQTAQELIEIAINDSERAIGYYWRGLARYKLGQLDLAERDLLRALELKKNYAGPYVTLAAISYARGEYRQGFEYAQTCAEIDPEYAWCYNNIGIGYLHLGQRQKGIENMEKAVSLAPDVYVFQANLKRAREGV